MFAHVPVKRAELDVVVETRDVAHAVRIVEQLEEAGFPTRRIGQGE
jgi:hypothetical protein